MSDTAFFSEIAAFESFAEVSDAKHYRPAPGGWDVVITDVKGSTDAIEAGRYKDVNALGVASIVALRNALKGVDIPFTFGGDGATLLLPASHREAYERALRGLEALARDAFEMELRVGVVPVAELRAAGHELLVARHRASEHIVLAMFAGAGFSVAEKWIKDPSSSARWTVGPGEAEADLEGFECRWQPIPSQAGVTLSVLVQATSDDPGAASATYSRVLQFLQSELGEAGGRPVVAKSLKLAPVTSGFEREVKLRTKTKEEARLYLRGIRKAVALGKLLFRTTGWRPSGKERDTYQVEVAANTDFRKFDDTLRMVIDVDDAQVAKLHAYLSREHEAGALVWGTHASSAATMTCAVGSYAGDHVHFVDGSDGGYALAAKQMKAQLANLAAKHCCVG